MVGEEAGLDDDHVATLLKQDAKNTAKQYKLVGMDAFLPKKSRSGAPKPNTNFLRHIIRQTDNHNAALLAKEAHESRARLKQMNRGAGSNSNKREAGRLTPPDHTDEEKLHRKRKRAHTEDNHGERDRRRRRATEDSDNNEPRSRRKNYKEKDRRRDRESHHSSEEDDRKYQSRHSKRDRRSEQRRDYGSDDNHNRPRHKDGCRRRHRRQHSSSRSRSRSPSRSRHSHKHHKSSIRQRRSRSRTHSLETEQRRSRSKRTHEERPPKRKTVDSCSDSDPLAEIIGPLPPTEPVVHTRGRGAHKAQSMSMDARFSSTYDPSVDVHLNSDVEDDWGDALEALRDRQRWKQQGSDRLKAAGFSEEEVKKWEKGDEKTEDDVRWSKKGESREWDRGKVLDDDGDVDLKADWGRLK